MVKIEWLASAGCFVQVQWKAIQTIWGLHQALLYLGMTVCGCHNSVMLKKPCAVSFLMIVLNDALLGLMPSFLKQRS